MSAYMQKLLAKKEQKTKEIKAKLAGESFLDIGDPSITWGTGGIPRGHVSLFYGPTKSGKSALAQKAAGLEQQKSDDGWVVVFDSEYAYPDPRETDENDELTARAKAARERYQKAGLDPDRMIIFSSNSMNELFGEWPGLEKEIRKGSVNVVSIIVDSWRAIQSRSAINRLDKGEIDTAGQKVGGNAKDINPMIQSILGVCADCGITGLFVQHCMVNLDQYGPKWILVGGEMLKFLCSMILFVEGSEAQDASLLSGDVISSKEEKSAIGYRVGKKIRFKCEKSRSVVEGRRGEFFVNFDTLQFALPEVSLFNLASNLGVIAHPKTPVLEEKGENKGKQKVDKKGDLVFKESIAYWEYPAGAPSPLKFHGKQAVLDELKTNKELYKEVFQACWHATGKTATTEEFSEVQNA